MDIYFSLVGMSAFNVLHGIVWIEKMFWKRYPIGLTEPDSTCLTYLEVILYDLLLKES